MKIGNTYVEYSNVWIVETFPQSSVWEKVTFLLVLMLLWIKHKILPGFVPVDHGDLREILKEGNVGIQLENYKAAVQKWEQWLENGDSYKDICQVVHSAFWLDSVQAILKSFWMKGWFLTDSPCFVPIEKEGKVFFKQCSSLIYVLTLGQLFVVRHLENLLPKETRKSLFAKRASRVETLPFLGDGYNNSFRQLLVIFFLITNDGREGLFYPKQADLAFHAMWTECPLAAISLGVYLSGWLYPHFASVNLVDDGGNIVEGDQTLTEAQMCDLIITNLEWIALILKCDPSLVCFD